MTYYGSNSNCITTTDSNLVPITNLNLTPTTNNFFIDKSTDIFQRRCIQGVYRWGRTHPPTRTHTQIKKKRGKERKNKPAPLKH